jgi:hypothetical protein
VVTTIFKPSAAMEKVASLPGWCLVIVADKKTPDELYLQGLAKAQDHVVYLSAKVQEDMAAGGGALGQFVSGLPWNHFSRKNVGFLFAVGHGAQLIFDFDDDNELKVPNPMPCENDTADCDRLRVLDPEPLIRGVPEMSAEAKQAAAKQAAPERWELPVFNPYPLMGATTSTSWPRGFPMQQIKREQAGWGLVMPTEMQALTTIPLERVAVIQMLADHDPDVDGIFRLTQLMPFSFRPPPTQPSVVLGAGTYAPTNAQATLHTRAAMWATLLPKTGGCTAMPSALLNCTAG